jgi:hypothetical protein
MKIFAKLLEVQKKLKVGKGQKNDFGGYNYRSAEDILEKARPLCNELGLVLTTDCEMILLGDRYYAKVFAQVADVESDEKFGVYGEAREQATRTKMDESQLTGVAESYAKKRALGNLFALDDTMDADSNEFHNETTKRSAVAKTTPTPAPKPTPKPMPQNTPKPTAQNRANKEHEERNRLLKEIGEKAREKGIAPKDLSLAAKFVYSTPTNQIEKVGELGIEDLREFAEKFEGFVGMAKAMP